MARTYETIDDLGLIWLFAGELAPFRVAADGQTIERANRTEWKPLKTFVCHKGYLFVRLYHRNCRRAVAVHKLLWMLANGRPVPEGYELHHKKTKRDNHPSDIELMSGAEHDAHHGYGDF